MNHTYRLVWNEASQTYVPAAEGTRARKKSGGCKALKRVSIVAAASLGSACIGSAYAGPTGGEVVAGQASIAQNGNTTTISQQSQNVSLNWQQFNVAANETVQFVQPSSTSIALNRVIGTDASQIFGQLSANGRVFLINPNGVLFGQSAQVNVGGLVASTLNISDADFLAGRYQFANTTNTPGSVVNQGTITAATGGSVALLGGQVSNQGTISAQLGTVALAAGSAVSLDFTGQQLMNVRVDAATLGALADNQQLIRADGGTVIMTAVARDALLSTVVNNTGVIEARTAQNQNGVIKLLGSFEGGTVNVDGTLDASAPNGGNGGFIETSGAHVKIADTAHITTFAPQGTTGTWLIDPVDFTIGAGGDIDGATLSNVLQNSNVSFATTQDGFPGDGDINVNEDVTWSSPTRLTLTAIGDVNVNAAITNTASPVGSGVSLRADSAGACVAGAAASACGTVNFTGTGHITADVVDIYYNPVGSNAAADANGIGPSYAAPTDYSANVTGTLNAYMLVNDVNQLQAMEAYLGGSYALGRDIDASATAGWNDAAGFVPLGSYQGDRFSGVFDGLGHTVSNLTIDRPFDNAVALFRYNEGGTIRQVNLLGAAIVGDSHVAGLVAINTGTVSDVSVDGSVAGGSWVGGVVADNEATVRLSSASASVTGLDHVGGLVGENRAGGAVSNSSATGVVTGERYVGGLVGRNRSGSTVSGAIASGAVEGLVNVGGLVGYNAGAVSDSDATGEVTGEDNVGGLVGTNSNTGTLTDTDATGQVTGNRGVGGLVGINNGAMVSANATGAVSGNSTVGGLIGHNTGNVNLVSATGTVSATDALIGGLVGYNSGTVIGGYATGSVSGDSFVGGLVGSNDGIGIISVSQATGDVTAQWGAGGLVGANYNVVVGSYATGAVSANGEGSAGGLVGYNGGTVENSCSTGSVSGTWDLGGLIGQNDGAVHNSFYNVDQITINGAHAVTLGALYDSQFQDWFSHGLYLDVDHYFTYSGGHFIIDSIQDLKDLLGFAQVADYSFQLGADLDLAAAPGLYIPEFSAAQFDGAGHTISNLNVDLPYAGTVGLFGYVGSSSTITNVTLTGASVTGYWGVGALAGWNDGTITASSATGSVSGLSNVGGLVGLNQGTISDSYAMGAVDGTWSLGGLVGANRGVIDNAWYNVDQSTINGAHAVSRAALYDNQFQDWLDNGLTLDVDDYFDSSNGRYLIGNLQDFRNLLGFAEIAGYSFALTADIDLAAAPGLYIPEFTADLFVGAGYTISNLNIDAPYAAQVGLFGHVGSSSVLSDVKLTGATITADQGVGAVAGWNEGTITAVFATGSIHGNGYVGGLVGMNTGFVVNAHMDGSVTGDALVGGLIGLNSDSVDMSDANASVTGTYGVGGLIGVNDADPISVSVSNVFATGSVTGEDAIGGLIGYNRGALLGAYATGAVNGNDNVGGLLGLNEGIASNSYATGSVHGRQGVGGLVGTNTGQLSDAYATGAVDGEVHVGGLVGFNTFTAAVNRTYATGQVSGTDASFTSGLVGFNDGGTIGDSFWDVETSGQIDLFDGRGIGRTTAQMHDADTFSAWGNELAAAGGSSATWRIYDGLTGPLLRYFMVNYTIHVEDVSATYNGLAQTLNPTYNTADLDTSRIFAEATTYRNAGSYAGARLYSGQQGYDIIQTGGAVTIERANLVISSADVTRAYNGTTTANGVAVAANGTAVLGTDSLSGGAFAFDDKNAGTGKRVTVGGVTVNDGNGGANYNVSYADNTTSTIERATLTYTASAPNRVYDGTTAASVTLSGLTGLVGNETIVVTGTGTFNSRDVATANTVTVNTVSLANGANGGLASNYRVDPGVTTAAHITPASLTVTANNQSRAAGTPNPALTLSYSGFVAGDSAASLTTRPVASTTANRNSLAGTYAITASGAASSNYVFTYVPGALTVTGTQVLPDFAGTLSYLDNVGSDDLPEAWNSVDLDAEQARLKKKQLLLEVRGTGIALPAGVQ